MKNKKKAYKTLVETSMNENYTTGNLLVYLYHWNYHKSIGIDLSRRTHTSISQQVPFIEKLEENDGATFFLFLFIYLFFFAEKQQKPILNFSLDSLIVKE